MGDVHAIRAMNAAKARGVSVGYDKLRMGETAAELLLGKMAGRRVESVIVESGAIVERESVAWR